REGAISISAPATGAPCSSTTMPVRKVLAGLSAGFAREGPGFPTARRRRKERAVRQVAVMAAPPEEGLCRIRRARGGGKFRALALLRGCLERRPASPGPSAPGPLSHTHSHPPGRGGTGNFPSILGKGAFCLVLGGGAPLPCGGSACGRGDGGEGLWAEEGSGYGRL